MDRADKLFDRAQVATRAYQRKHGLKAGKALWARFFTWFEKQGLAGLGAAGW